mgnify:CR=1 FL=1
MSMSSYTPSELIMARTEAFASGDFGFIYDSYHPESNFRRQFPDRGEYCRYGVEVGQQERRDGPAGADAVAIEPAELRSGVATDRRRRADFRDLG